MRSLPGRILLPLALAASAVAAGPARPDPELVVLNRHPGAVLSKALTPDGRCLVTGAADGTVRVWDLRDGAEVARLAHDGGPVQALRFSPDGATLATCGPTGNPVLLWEAATWRLRRRLTLPRPPASDDPAAWWEAVLPRRNGAPELTSTELEQLWAQLALEDAGTAYDAVCALAAAPRQAVPFLSGRLSWGRPVDEERVRQLIRDLDDDRFTVRERAVKELGEVGDAAEPHLREMLERRSPRPSPEAVQRAELLLQHLGTAGVTNDADTLRALRALEVLELSATPEAKAALAKLARVPLGPRLRRRAAGAAERLERVERAALQRPRA